MKIAILITKSAHILFSSEINAAMGLMPGQRRILSGGYGGTGILENDASTSRKPSGSSQAHRIGTSRPGRSPSHFAPAARTP